MNDRILDRSTLFILLIAFMAVLFLTADTSAQWEELPSEGTTVDFALTANEKAQSVYGTAIHAGKSYWAGINGTQISHEGEVLSQDLAARVQGGKEFYGVSIQAFAEATRDDDSEITTATGAYLRKIIEMNRLAIVLGGGSYVERDQFAEVKGFDESGTEASAGGSEILPYWLFIVGGEYDLTETIGCYGKIIGKPQANFSRLGGIFDIGADIVLNKFLGHEIKDKTQPESIMRIIERYIGHLDEWTLKFQSTSEFEWIDGKTHTSTENSVILSLNF